MSRLVRVLWTITAGLALLTLLAFAAYGLDHPAFGRGAAVTLVAATATAALTAWEKP